MTVEDQIWQVSFMDYDLGYFDMDSCRLEPGPNPFGPRVLTMWPVQTVNDVSSMYLFNLVGPPGLEPGTKGLCKKTLKDSQFIQLEFHTSLETPGGTFNAADATVRCTTSASNLAAADGSLAVANINPNFLWTLGF